MIGEELKPQPGRVALRCAGAYESGVFGDSVTIHGTAAIAVVMIGTLSASLSAGPDGGLSVTIYHDGKPLRFVYVDAGGYVSRRIERRVQRKTRR